MVCVVCGGETAEQHFANAWEKTRKLYPCCSPACAAKFDPDVHWLPAAAPKHSDADEQMRLLRMAKGRLRAGDTPTVVVRELLVAGVGLVGIENLLNEAERDAAIDARKARRRNILGAIALVFGRHVREAPEPQRPEALRGAARDLDAWRARFGPPGDPTRSA